MRGILIGAGIGLLPVLIGGIFGPSTGEGGAYITFVTFPVGVIAGTISGMSRRKFFINSDSSKFRLFHKRMKY